jgi:hypothetical protein
MFALLSERISTNLAQVNSSAAGIVARPARSSRGNAIRSRKSLMKRAESPTCECPVNVIASAQVHLECIAPVIPAIPGAGIQHLSFPRFREQRIHLSFPRRRESSICHSRDSGSSESTCHSRAGGNPAFVIPAQAGIQHLSFPRRRESRTVGNTGARSLDARLRGHDARANVVFGASVGRL